MAEVEEIDAVGAREATVAEVRRVLEDHVVEDDEGFYSRWVEIETDVLQEVLRLLEANAEGLLDSRAGLALANTAWNEGSAAGIRYAQGSQPEARPRSPYAGPLLSLLRTKGATE